MNLKFYDKCLLRVPYFSCNTLKYIDNIDYILSLDSFKEAIYIASPSLYHKCYIKNDRSERTIFSLIKYFSRACSRCTPYGLFAGSQIVSVKDFSEIEIVPEEDYKIYSRIDMEYLCDFIRLLEQDISLKNKLTYHVNTSLYYVNNHIRYIEYKMTKNKRSYSFSEVVLTDYLDMIIENLSSRSQTIDELVDIILSPDVTLSDAKEFLYDLVDAQILVSELEPSIAGDDLLFQLKNKLQKLDYPSPFLDKIISLLHECDNCASGLRLKIYEKINKLLSEHTINQKENMFHVDCNILTSQSSVGKTICDTVIKGIEILKKLTVIIEDENLVSFKKAFYERYEEQEIPLAIAMDPQIGIGFGTWNNLKGDINPLIDDLTIPNTIEQHSYVNLDPLTTLLISKYEKCICNNAYTMTLEEDDLNKLQPINTETIHDHLYTIVKVIDIGKEHSEATIFMNMACGASAANLLSRFAYLNNEINVLINEITETETKYYSDKIIAEVLHFPEDRLGNIQMHPQHRKFEIPYISNSNSSDPKTNVISINDIMVSVPHGKKIVLHSKKFNKEILPRLTTAHSYNRGLPIYSFLCSLQHENKNNLYFNWGNFFNYKQFLPRVTYDNIILSPAMWFFSISDIPEQNNESFDDYYFKLMNWKMSKKLPDLVQISEGDNKLLIDFTKKMSLKILIDIIRKKKTIYLEEYLFANTKYPLTKRGKEYFANELILCLHNNYE